MEHKWKDLKVYNQNLTKLYDFTNIYQISNNGDIKNIKRKSLLKNYKHKSGYHTVSLSKDGFSKSFFLHRVVASSFIVNPVNKIIVNHIDRNKSNNNVTNLEWVTVHENILHSRETGINSYCRPIDQYDLEGTFIQTFSSITDAAKSINSSIPKIINYCNNRTQCKKYLWEYHNKSEECAKNNIIYNTPSHVVFVLDITRNTKYEIYENGRVFSKEYKRFLNPTIKNGYLSVTLHPEKKNYLIHQLVAIEFLDKPSNPDQIYVNHKDKNKQNNHHSNLEWCTHKENMEHCNNIEVYQYDKQGILFNKYNSVLEAAENAGVSSCLISSVMNGRGHTAAGYIWRKDKTKFTLNEIELLYNPPHSTSARVIQYSKDGKEIKRFTNSVEAAKVMKIDPSQITKVCRGKLKTCGGFIWKYECQENTDSKNIIKRLTPDQKNEILNKHKKGFTTKELAEKYSKSISQIQKIIRSK
jgi:hypothetical protein